MLAHVADESIEHERIRKITSPFYSWSVRDAPCLAMTGARGRPIRPFGAGSLKPNRAHKFACCVDRLSQQLAELHCSYQLESEWQTKVLRLKWDLLNEMCSLFEVTLPILRKVQAHPSQNPCPYQPGHPSEDKSAAAVEVLDRYYDSISSYVPSTHPSFAQLACLHPPVFHGTNSPLGWDSDQPAVSTLSGGNLLGLLTYSLLRIHGEPELLESVCAAPIEYVATLYDRARGEAVGWKTLQTALWIDKLSSEGCRSSAATRSFWGAAQKLNCLGMHYLDTLLSACYTTAPQKAALQREAASQYRDPCLITSKGLESRLISLHTESKGVIVMPLMY
jgi:hypothetical protein